MDVKRHFRCRDCLAYFAGPIRRLEDSGRRLGRLGGCLGSFWDLLGLAGEMIKDVGLGGWVDTKGPFGMVWNGFKLFAGPIRRLEHLGPCLGGWAGACFVGRVLMVSRFRFGGRELLSDTWYARWLRSQ